MGNQLLVTSWSSEQQQINLSKPVSESRHWNITTLGRRGGGKGIPRAQEDQKGKLELTDKVKRQASMQKKKAASCTFSSAPNSQHQRRGSNLLR